MHSHDESLRSTVHPAVPLSFVTTGCDIRHDETCARRLCSTVFHDVGGLDLNTGGVVTHHLHEIFGSDREERVRVSNDDVLKALSFRHTHSRKFDVLNA